MRQLCFEGIGLTRVIRQPGDWIFIGAVASLWVANLNIPNSVTGGGVYGNDGLKNAAKGSKVNQSVSITPTAPIKQVHSPRSRV